MGGFIHIQNLRLTQMLRSVRKNNGWTFSLQLQMNILSGVNSLIHKSGVMVASFQCVHEIFHIHATYIRTCLSVIVETDSFTFVQFCRGGDSDPLCSTEMCTNTQAHVCVCVWAAKYTQSHIIVCACSNPHSA